MEVQCALFPLAVAALEAAQGAQATRGHPHQPQHHWSRAYGGGGRDHAWDHGGMPGHAGLLSCASVLLASFLPAALPTFVGDRSGGGGRGGGGGSNRFHTEAYRSFSMTSFMGGEEERDRTGGYMGNAPTHVMGIDAFCLDILRSLCTVLQPGGLFDACRIMDAGGASNKRANNGSGASGSGTNGRHNGGGAMQLSTADPATIGIHTQAHTLIASLFRFTEEMDNGGGNGGGRLPLPSKLEESLQRALRLLSSADHLRVGSRVFASFSAMDRLRAAHEVLSLGRMRGREAHQPNTEPTSSSASSSLPFSSSGAMSPTRQRQRAMLDQARKERHTPHHAHRGAVGGVGAGGGAETAVASLPLQAAREINSRVIAEASQELWTRLDASQGGTTQVAFCRTYLNSMLARRNEHLQSAATNKPAAEAAAEVWTALSDILVVLATPALSSSSSSSSFSSTTRSGGLDGLDVASDRDSAEHGGSGNGSEAIQSAQDWGEVRGAAVRLLQETTESRCRLLIKTSEELGPFTFTDVAATRHPHHPQSGRGGGGGGEGGGEAAALAALARLAGDATQLALSALEAGAIVGEDQGRNGPGDGRGEGRGGGSKGGREEKREGKRAFKAKQQAIQCGRRLGMVLRVLCATEAAVTGGLGRGVLEAVLLRVGVYLRSRIPCHPRAADTFLAGRGAGSGVGASHTQHHHSSAAAACAVGVCTSLASVLTHGTNGTTQGFTTMDPSLPHPSQLSQQQQQQQQQQYHDGSSDALGRAVLCLASCVELLRSHPAKGPQHWGDINELQGVINQGAGAADAAGGAGGGAGARVDEEDEEDLSFDLGMARRRLLTTGRIEAGEKGRREGREEGMGKR